MENARIYRVAQIKYPTGQNAISRQPCKILSPNFLVYVGEITIVKYKKIISVFSKVMAIQIFYATFSILQGIINSNLKFLFTSWFLRASVSVGRRNCISFQTRPKCMLNCMLKPCCRNLFKNADLFCHLASSFNQMACLHTWQSWLKTGLLPTAVNSLVKMNGLRTRLTYVWGAMLERYKSFQPSRRT